VNASTAGSSGQIVVAGAGYAGLSVALRLTAKAAQQPRGADPGRPARLPPGAHRASPHRRRHPRRHRARRQWLRQGHQGHIRDSHGGDPRRQTDAEAMVKENAMAVIRGITRDKGQRRRDSS
jgi:hypothetical protein